MAQVNKAHQGGRNKRGDGSAKAVLHEYLVQRDPDIRGVSKGRRETEGREGRDERGRS